MNTIRTYDDLIAEKKRLEDSLRIQKQLIKYDIASLREEFAPVHNVITTAKKITSSKTDNPLFRAGLALAGDFLLKKTFLLGGGWVTRLMAPIVLGGISKMFIGKKPQPIKNLIGKVFHRSNGKSKA